MKSFLSIGRKRLNHLLVRNEKKLKEDQSVVKKAPQTHQGEGKIFNS